MKLVTFRAAAGGDPRAGALLPDGQIVDLAAACVVRRGAASPLMASVLAIAEGGERALDLARELVAAPPDDARRAAAAVRLLAPIPEPPQMRDFLCFERHLLQAYAALRRTKANEAPDPEAALREMEAKGQFGVPATWYERPIYYKPSRFAVCGPDTDVVWPRYSTLMDFECEFGCYIGKPGRDIPAERAREHIFGYTVFNDFSARDEQTKEMPGLLGPGKGKDFDDSNAMGPCLVTADELGDPYALEMIVRVNGEEWNRGSSSGMHWTFEDCIAYVSRAETVRPGEFFGSGTVGGGCGLEHLRFLAPGDVVEIEVEGIGTLRNRVLRDD